MCQRDAAVTKAKPARKKPRMRALFAVATTPLEACVAEGVVRPEVEDLLALAEDEECVPFRRLALRCKEQANKMESPFSSRRGEGDFFFLTTNPASVSFPLSLMLIPPTPPSPQRFQSKNHTVSFGLVMTYERSVIALKLPASRKEESKELMDVLVRCAGTQGAPKVDWVAV